MEIMSSKYYVNPRIPGFELIGDVLLLHHAAAHTDGKVVFFGFLSVL